MPWNLDTGDTPTFFLLPDDSLAPTLARMIESGATGFLENLLRRQISEQQQVYAKDDADITYEAIKLAPADVKARVVTELEVYVEQVKEDRKKRPTITWKTPDDIESGVKLDSVQLNATADVIGGFVYDPPEETVLEKGGDQVLSTTFTPDDGNNYATVSATVTINVA